MDAPSIATMTQLLRKCEQGVHKAGWDQQPLVVALVWGPGSAMFLYNTGIPVRGKTPADFLNRLGHAFLVDPECGQAVQDDVGQSFFGFAHIWEGFDETTPEHVETRVICVVDLFARPYIVRRRRGKKPEILAMSDAVRGYGDVHRGLAKMVLGSVQQMPWAADYQLELELLLMPQLTDLISAAHSLG
jgi:hypothetical protein